MADVHVSRVSCYAGGPRKLAEPQRMPTPQAFFSGLQAGRAEERLAPGSH